MTDTVENSAAESETTPLIIKPLILQHAEDAAFYWTQRSTKAHSPLLRFDRLTHFDRLLTAHLDGLRVAGDVGWECALKNLQRWKACGRGVRCLRAGNRGRRQDALANIVERGGKERRNDAGRLDFRSRLGCRRNSSAVDGLLAAPGELSALATNSVARICTAPPGTGCGAGRFLCLAGCRRPRSGLRIGRAGAVG